MALRATVTDAQRSKLIDQIKKDPGFRQKLKENWADAFRDVGIDPAHVKGRELRDSETIPYGGDPVKAGITITITITAMAAEEKINIEDVVTFEPSKTR
jgi:hypothetical protein